MAMITIARDGNSLGNFTDEAVREGLGSGRFLPTDLGWREGMAAWQTLREFPEFAANMTGAAPVAAITPAPAVVDPSVTRTGLPWEHREQLGFLNAFVETLKVVLVKPAEAFSIMKREGGFGSPLLYAIIGGSLGGIVSLLFSMGLQSFGLMSDRQNAFGMLAGMGIGSVFFIILIPLIIVIGSFIGAGIVHLCLMLVGGANKSFETTYRVLAFSHGSTGPLQMVPFCGAFLAGIWALVLCCIGLSRAQETTVGKAVLAVLLPMIVCCGGGFVLVMVFGVGAAMMQGNH